MKSPQEAPRNSHHLSLSSIPIKQQSTYPSVQENTLFTHSFSRTCPVILSYPKSGRSVEGLAIIDDQSIVSFVRPSIPEELNIAREDLISDVLINSTVNWIRKGETNLIKNLHVRPLIGGASTPIPCARTCHVPDALLGVPTPQEVSSIPGLSHLAKKSKQEGMADDHLYRERLCSVAKTSTARLKWGHPVS